MQVSLIIFLFIFIYLKFLFIMVRILNMRLTLLVFFLHAHYRIINYKHTVVQQVSRTYSFCITETLYHCTLKYNLSLFLKNAFLN